MAREKAVERQDPSSLIVNNIVTQRKKKKTIADSSDKGDQKNSRKHKKDASLKSPTDPVVEAIASSGKVSKREKDGPTSKVNQNRNVQDEICATEADEEACAAAQLTKGSNSRDTDEYRIVEHTTNDIPGGVTTEAASSTSPVDMHSAKVAAVTDKYLKRNDIASSDFALSLVVVDFQTSSFYKFAKKYFTSLSAKELEQKVKNVMHERHASSSIPSLVKTPEVVNTPAALPKGGERHSKRKAPMNEHELLYNAHAEQGKSYALGPLNDKERLRITEAVEEHCQASNITLGEFCNQIWDLPKPMSASDKRNLYSKFIYLLPERKATNIRHFIRRAYIPFDREPFTAEDDETILDLYCELGSDWKAIAARMGRYQHDVRDHYRNQLLMRDRHRGAWSPEELKRFRTILGHYESKDDMNWQSIADQMGTRSRAQCRDRYYRLTGERSKIVLSARKRLRTPSVDGELAIAKRPKTKRKEKILPGDILHMLKLLKESKAKTFEDALTSDTLAIYDGTFTLDEITRTLLPELDKTRRSLSKQTKRAIKRLKALPERELTRTLVVDSDAE